MLHEGVAAVTEAIDPELLALIPEPFLTVKPGDQVTLFLGPTDLDLYLVHKTLERWAPEVKWFIVDNVGFTGVIHVAREDRTPQP